MEITDKDRLDFIINNCYVIELVSLNFNYFKFDENDDLRGDIDKAIMAMREKKSD